MIAASLRALNSRGVSAVLLAVGLGIAYFPRGGTDPESIEAAARRPAPAAAPS